MPSLPQQWASWTGYLPIHHGVHASSGVSPAADPFGVRRFVARNVCLELFNFKVLRRFQVEAPFFYP
eukprot:187954-Amphidinium_carterae.1